jgi:hypothetical protein
LRCSQSTTAMFLIFTIMFGCSDPSVISVPPNPRLCISSAASYLPWSHKTKAKLSMLVKVSGCCDYSTFLPSSARRPGSSASYLPRSCCAKAGLLHSSACANAQDL